jgi:hypothetical protein
MRYEITTNHTHTHSTRCHPQCDASNNVSRDPSGSIFWQYDDAQSTTPSQTPTLIVTPSQSRWWESSTVDEDRALSDEEPWYDAEKKTVLLGDSVKQVFDNIEHDEDWDEIPLKFRPHLFNALKRVRSKLDAETEEKLVLFPNPAFDSPSFEDAAQYIFPVKYPRV